DRRRQVTQRELERDVEDDVPRRVRLEPRAAVGEPAVGGGDRRHGAARTVAIVSATSCPYAPTFWIGVAPTSPGTPDIDSRPDQPSSTARTTSSSQSSPAATRPTAPEHASDSTRPPRTAIRTTVPSKPSSAITTLLPRPSSSTGSPPSSQDRTASIRSASVSTVTSLRAGPPIRSGLRPAGTG